MAPTVSQFYRGKYPFLYYSIPARRNFLYFAFCCEPFVGPVGTASVAPFVGPDDALSPLRWMSTHLHRCRTTQGSLADSFLLLSHYYYYYYYYYLSASQVNTSQDWWGTATYDRLSHHKMMHHTKEYKGVDCLQPQCG